ncbi:TPA: hypothetical protein NGT97_004401 [Vibrio parahaemolyticus]|uniref:hypothetical protein n=1 Tax=Vibrio parahaemolyticus TaxID=670 RepID=UPI002361689D|nr:hypothetical protein [Vibrio parahaemolyticus]HCE2478671.1 hypothetical protein [Vibrio parahaemolyticus]
MITKLITIVSKSWKSTLAWWSVFPVSAVAYSILNQLGLVKSSDAVPKHVDTFYTEVVLNVEKANAYFVMLPLLFLILWLLHVNFRLKRKQRVYLRKVFEFFLNPVTKLLTVASGVMGALILLHFCSDIQLVNSYFAAVVFAFMGLFGALMLQVLSRDFFNILIVNNRS